MINKLDFEKCILYIGSPNDREDILKDENKYKYHNISHSGDYLICAYSNIKIGCDIEEKKDINYINIINRFYTNDENKIIDSIKNEKDKIDLFYDIWTKKESYIKRDGRGMEIPLDSFSVLDEKKLGASFIKVNVDKNYACNICI